MNTSTKTDSPILKKAYDDEKLFPLLARDQSAPKIIALWIAENIHTQPAHKLLEALQTAIDMSDQHAAVNNRKTREMAEDREFKINDQF